MDQLRAIEAEARRDEPAMDRPPKIGTDERRMHVRAYNFWVSMLGGRAYPSIEDLDPAHSGDFGAHSVLLDFTAGIAQPTITFLGNALRVECGLDHRIDSIADVPSRSLLSRLTDHYLQILANRAPIGFEAEFVSQRGHNTLYRGILMPYSSDDDTIDFVYGVINWKELAAPTLAADLALEMEQAMAAPARVAAPRASSHATPVWADGPSGGLDEATADESAIAFEPIARARAALREAPPRAMLDIPSDGGEFVLLLARRQVDGRLAVLAPVPDETTLVDRAIRKVTR